MINVVGIVNGNGYVQVAEIVMVDEARDKIIVTDEEGNYHGVDYLTYSASPADVAEAIEQAYETETIEVELPDIEALKDALDSRMTDIVDTLFDVFKSK